MGIRVQYVHAARRVLACTLPTAIAVVPRVYCPAELHAHSIAVKSAYHTILDLDKT